MKRWRRRLLLLALLVLAGAAINLAIALAFAAAADGSPFRSGRRLGATLRSLGVPDADSVTSYRVVQITEYGWPLRALGATTGGHGVLGNPSSLEAAREWAEEARRNPPPAYSKGRPAPEILQDAGWFQRSGGRVPTTALWGGLIGNTLFYTTMLALPVAILPIRRYLRARRGSCAQCGYDLRGCGGQRCPECGAATTADDRAPTARIAAAAPRAAGWKRWRRGVLIALCLLFAGAIINIGVAWDSAAHGLPKSGVWAAVITLTPGPDFDPDEFLAGQDLPLLEWVVARGSRAERRIWRHSEVGQDALQYPLVFNLGIEWLEQSERAPERFVAGWGLSFDANGSPRLDLPDGSEEAHGWPMRSLCGAMLYDGKTPSPRAVWAHPLDEGRILGRARSLPLRPIPLGFAVNTVFYAALTGLLLSPLLMLFPIRRRLRARHGRCPKCGYDLAGLGGARATAPCPECGAAR